jgi:hypothetical protein
MNSFTKSRYGVILSFLVLLIFVFSSFQYSYAASGNLSKTFSIDIQFHANPDVVDAGKKVKFTMIIKSQNTSTFINSAELITPWSNIRQTINQTIDPNRALVKEIEFKIPVNASNGKHFVNLLVTTQKSDFNSETEVTVKKIQSIPLSGDIPLSVLIIIFSGIITYLIPIFLLTQKFERNYVEVTLASIGLGLFNWLILYQINIVGDWGIISDEPTSIAFLLIFSLAMGFGIFVVVSLIIIPIQNLIRSKRTVRGRFLDLTRTGITSSENIWQKSLRAETDRAKRIGRVYSLALKVKLKSDPQRVIVGILHFFEP